MDRRCRVVQASSRRRSLPWCETGSGTHSTLKATMDVEQPKHFRAGTCIHLSHPGPVYTSRICRRTARSIPSPRHHAAVFKCAPAAPPPPGTTHGRPFLRTSLPLSFARTSPRCRGGSISAGIACHFIRLLFIRDWGLLSARSILCPPASRYSSV
ncbi:hypothetical protein EJ06DRAFT_60146 [Trichodelitschia bisporula]|uniref:Uncharacterized protein n=1 Tax=Trichodelitschia bisporula TaxID=703511 RepID=A0A6G1HUL4_9PEZI|nr:hypothetical protein EJ06DRAFT_60146 [Trichodelitschia bisporula]